MSAAILALDTSTERESVAVVESGSIVGEVRLRTADSHSRRLLPAVDFLLSSLGLAPGELAGFAVTVGPGSFTGLRVGLSTVQGLALAASRPCLGLSTLDVLAARLTGRGDCLVALMDAYRGQVFGAVYDRAARLQSERTAEDPRAFLASLPERPVLIGDGVARYRDLIAELRPQAEMPEDELFLAGTLGRLAEPLLAEGRGHGPEALRPLYLRGADVRAPGGR
jgi:tRNA threonylcarbamoyladenosine biosynthesis protein TsaB